MTRSIIALFFALVFASSARAQSVALKSNLLVDATASPHLAVELGLAPRWTFELGGSINSWTMGHGRRWKHWILQPEARYWFCDRFVGHHVGLHVLGGQYNIGGLNGDIPILSDYVKNLNQSRYQGWMVGAGLMYGYDWILSTHWNLEAEIGVGYIYTRTDTYRCVGCGRRTSSNRPHNYVGPTKAALSLVYTF